MFVFLSISYTNLRLFLCLYAITFILIVFSWNLSLLKKKKKEVQKKIEEIREWNI